MTKRKTPQKKLTITFYPEPDLHAWLRARAARDERALSETIKRILRAQMARERKR